MSVVNWGLLYDFTIRDIKSKYRKSHLGMLWAVFTPLLTWGVYSLVFTSILGLHKLPSVNADASNYIFSLFVGLSVFFFFSEVLSASPSYISSRPSFVKKVVFPINILIISKVLSSAFGFLINIMLLFVFMFIFNQGVPLSSLLFPVVLIPILLFIIGMAYILASLGVFIPDISQFTNPLSRMLFYATPIVYPLTLLPELYQTLIWLNPMTSMVEPLRAILINRTIPEWDQLGLFMTAAVVVSLIGFFIFNRVKRGFADVL